jgi:hypothetical protein
MQTKSSRSPSLQQLLTETEASLTKWRAKRDASEQGATKAVVERYIAYLERYYQLLQRHSEIMADSSHNDVVR